MLSFYLIMFLLPALVIALSILLAKLDGGNNG
jgi:hypothetical protein